jgi:hypothetical protein
MRLGAATLRQVHPVPKLNAAIIFVPSTIHRPSRQGPARHRFLPRHHAPRISPVRGAEMTHTSFCGDAKYWRAELCTCHQAATQERAEMGDFTTTGGSTNGLLRIASYRQAHDGEPKERVANPSPLITGGASAETGPLEFPMATCSLAQHAHRDSGPTQGTRTSPPQPRGAGRPAFAMDLEGDPGVACHAEGYQRRDRGLRKWPWSCHLRPLSRVSHAQPVHAQGCTSWETCQAAVRAVQWQTAEGIAPGPRLGRT